MITSFYCRKHCRRWLPRTSMSAAVLSGEQQKKQWTSNTVKMAKIDILAVHNLRKRMENKNNKKSTAFSAKSVWITKNKKSSLKSKRRSSKPKGKKWNQSTWVIFHHHSVHLFSINPYFFLPKLIPKNFSAIVGWCHSKKYFCCCHCFSKQNVVPAAAVLSALVAVPVRKHKQKHTQLMIETKN